ncbi:SanA/YdcF family protein [Tessaracoccus sp. G1721]
MDGRGRGGRAALILGVLMIVGLVPVAASGARVAWASSGRVHDVETVPARDVGMVLGAKADRGRPSAFLAARLDLALDLFEQGRIKAILVSGDGLARANHETDVMRDYLVERGVPADKIVADPAGFDTYDSCVRARDVYGVRELTVITQDYHLGRAITVCSMVGVDAVGVGDTSMRGRFPLNWIKGAGREWAANLKMEWDVASQREPQADPPDPSLERAVEA